MPEPTVAVARMEPLASLDPRSRPARAKVSEERSLFVSCSSWRESLSKVCTPGPRDGHDRKLVQQPRFTLRPTIARRLGTLYTWNVLLSPRIGVTAGNELKQWQRETKERLGVVFEVGGAAGTLGETCPRTCSRRAKTCPRKSRDELLRIV